jgi:hypothetical protein
MASGCRSLVDGLTVLVIGGVCFVVAALTWLPNMEQGQNEARLAMAWVDTQCIRDASIAEGQLSYGDRSKTDPWGEPYRLESDEDGTIRIVSSGPNGNSLEDGFDEDDIHSDMPASRAGAMLRRKQWQLMFTLAVAVAAWLLLSCLYLKSRRKPVEPDYVYSHDR